MRRSPRLARTEHMRVTIVNPPFPQLTALASELAGRGELTHYVHSFLIDQKGPAVHLKDVPIVGYRLHKTLTRRESEILHAKTTIHTPAILHELLRASLFRLPPAMKPLSIPLRDGIMRRRNKLMSRRGA